MTRPAEAGRGRSWRRRVVVVTLIALALWWFLGWLTVIVVTMPLRNAVADLDRLGGREVEDVELRTADGLRVSAWHVRASEERVVILFAGKGGDRNANRAEATHYLRRGDSVLLPDLRATGDSDGETVGLGWPERRDVAAWIAFARAEGYASIGLHGQSLGAAAIVYALTTDDAGLGVTDDVAFVVLESCYGDLFDALCHRLPLVPLPALSLFPVVWFGERALDAPLESLRPGERVARIAAPTLIVSGDRDGRAPIAEARAMFEASNAQVKRFVRIPGGRHEDLWAHDAATYAKALDGFLATVDDLETERDSRSE